MIVTILAFVLTLGILIVIHEFGHYRVAVACGVKVLRFSLGFGRVLWRRQPTPGGTEFVVCALPLGGYVRMLDEREGPVAPEDLGHAFNRKPLAQRAAIVAAGPIANLLLAIVLYAVAHWIGVDEPKAVLAAPVVGSLADQAGMHAGDWVRSTSTDGNEWRDVRSIVDLRWSVTQAAMHAEPLQLMLSGRDGGSPHRVTLALDTLPAGDLDAKTMQRIGLGSAFSEPVLGDLTPGGPAERSGLRRADRVLSIDGVLIGEATQVRDLIRASAASGKAVPMHWRVERSGRSLEFEVTAEVVTEQGQRFGRVGAFPGQPPELVMVRDGPLDGIGSAISQTWQMSALSVRMMGKMLVGEASLKNLSGPVTIADYAGQSVRLGLAYYLGFLAVVSVSLGVLNLLPLPVLDGGHLMYYLFEAVTGRPVSELWLDRLQRGGVAIVLMMMSVALYNDMARLLGQQ